MFYSDVRGHAQTRLTTSHNIYWAKTRWLLSKEKFEQIHEKLPYHIAKSDQGYFEQEFKKPHLQNEHVNHAHFYSKPAIPRSAFQNSRRFKSIQHFRTQSFVIPWDPRCYALLWKLARLCAAQINWMQCEFVIQANTYWHIDFSPNELWAKRVLEKCGIRIVFRNDK